MAKWQYFCVSLQSPVVDPDLQIRGGGEGGRLSRPWDKKGPRPQKKFFSALPHFGLKIRREAAPPDPSPGSATGLDNTFAPVDLINRSQSISGWSCSVSLLILTNNPLQRETTWATPSSEGNSLVVFCCLYLPPLPPKKRQSNNGH